MQFHLSHIIQPQMHGLNGYKEVIDSVKWGLEELGHSVSYGVNEIQPASQNIVFGAQVMSVAELSALPPETIIYNFEQCRGLQPEQFKESFKYAVANFRVWDYSPFNAEALATLTPKYPPIIVPVGYSPILERIPRVVEAEKDIDALIYGMPNVSRLSAFHLMSKTGMTVLFVCGLYGQARDGLIARSKVIVNLSLYTKSDLFEVVRISYLLANRKAVASYVSPTTAIEDDMHGTFAASDADNLVETVRALAASADARLDLEDRGYQAFKRRDIRPILARALAG